MMENRFLFTPAGISLVATLMLDSVADAHFVLTQHNDNYRTGAYTIETVLKPSNVRPGLFGKLFSQPVDGRINVQPLYVENVYITTGPAVGTVHNVVYVATDKSTVYAFDADNVTGVNAMPLWRSSLGGTPTSLGISSTPVIDGGTNTMYVVSGEDASFGGCPFSSHKCYRLHALDIQSGLEKFGGPVVLSGTVDGRGVGSVGVIEHDGIRMILRFDPDPGENHPALLLANGLVYIAFGSFQDQYPWHGWILAYDASTLSWRGNYAMARDYAGAGIWMFGNGPASDEQGNIYVMTGNTPPSDSGIGLNIRSGGNNAGESFVKLSPRLDRVLDWFVPCRADNWDTDGCDDDLGSSGPVLIPGTDALVGGGKVDYLYVLKRGPMGGPYGSLRDCAAELPYVYQRLPQESRSCIGDTTERWIYNSPIFWPGRSILYFWRGKSQPLVSYLVTQPSPPRVQMNGPTARSLAVAPSRFGGSLSLSSNGGADGILWALVGGPILDEQHVSQDGVLRAFDASNVAVELWNSEFDPARDAVGKWAKWNAPTVANGKVYVPSFSNMLHCYGLNRLEVGPPELSPLQIMSVINTILQ